MAVELCFSSWHKKPDLVASYAWNGRSSKRGAGACPDSATMPVPPAPGQRLLLSSNRGTGNRSQRVAQRKARVCRAQSQPASGAPISQSSAPSGEAKTTGRALADTGSPARATLDSGTSEPDGTAVDLTERPAPGNGVNVGNGASGSSGSTLAPEVALSSDGVLVGSIADLPDKLNGPPLISENDSTAAYVDALPKTVEPAQDNGGTVEVSHSASAGVVEKGGGWQNRWTIVGLCFFAFLLCNMDRVNMSIAILPMSTEFQWNPATVGLVQSSFFWGYLLTQIVGGVWADTYGGKQVLAFGVVWWSLATVLTPLAAKTSLPVLLFARACMGIGEGVAMPAMNNMLSKWVPVNERSRSLALVYSGMHLGSVLGLSLSPALINNFGWPSVFYSFGSLGAIWFVFWLQKAKSTPAQDPTLSRAERQLLLSAGSSEAVAGESHGGGGGHFAESSVKLSEIPWKLLLSKAPVWAIIISHFCHNWGIFILLTWMPTYYHDVLGFNLTESGLIAVLPWLTMAVASNAAGWIADSLISRGHDITRVRKVMQTVGFVGPAICLSLLPSVSSPAQAILLLMASQGTDAFSQSGLYSNHQDIGPRYAGILLGLSNTAGVLAGVLGTYVTGQILQTGSWDTVFHVAVILYLLGAVIWNVFATGKRVFN